MKNTTIFIFICLSFAGYGQDKVEFQRSSKKAGISEQIGITEVKIVYGRPGVKGREGKIWGDLVPYGFVDYHYGTSKAAPWRAGANENTTFECSTDVAIEGKSLAAGNYGFFIAMGAEKATLIFSRDNNSWGSFYYNPANDVLRVEVPVQKMNEMVEWLKYEFGNETDSSAVASLQWEKVRVPFTIAVDLKRTEVAAYRKAFNSGWFYRYWQNMQEAANYCLVNDVNLEEALTWADRSIHTYFGEANFPTLSTYAGLLEKAGRPHEADSVMKLAFTKGNTQEINNYGNGLLRMKKYKAAFAVFKTNYDKAPKESVTNFGMAKACAAIGNKDEAIKWADKTIGLLQGEADKKYVGRMKQDIMDGKDVSNY